MAAPATAEEIRDVNTRYHDGAAADYDAKWGIDFGDDRPARRSLGKLRKALGGRARARSTARSRSAPGTGYFTLNLLQAGVVARGGVHRHLARDARRRCAANAERLGPRRRRPSPPTPRRCRSPTTSFDLVLGHAVLHHLPDLDARVPRVPPRAAPGRHVRLRRRAVARRRPHRRRAQARAPRALAPAVAARCCARAPAPRGPRPTAARTTTSSRRTSTSTRSSPSELARLRRAAPGFERRARARRGAAGQLVRLGQPRARVDRRARGRPVAWRQYAYRGYLAAAEVDRRAARAAAARRRSSTT